MTSFAMILAPLMSVAADDAPTPELISAPVVQTYADDGTILLANTTLHVKAGSSYYDLDVEGNELTVTVPAGMAFEIRTSGPPTALENDGLLPTCDILRDSSNQLMIAATADMDRTVRLHPATGNCSTANASTDTTPTLSFGTSLSGVQLAMGDEAQLFWQTTNGTVASVSMQLSLDGGETYGHEVMPVGINGGYFNWTVPEVETTNEARLRIYGWDQGRVKALAVSSLFRIEGLAPSPEQDGEASVIVEAYDYEVDIETFEAATISADKGLLPTAGGTQTCVPDTRLKAKGFDTLYYCGRDGKRYVFPNEKTHRTWYGDSFAGVVEWELADIAKIPLGGNVTYRPGVRMVKIQSANEVFAVAADGTLRYVASEAVAERLYGKNWNTMIDDIPDAFFTNYTIGTPIYK